MAFGPMGVAGALGRPDRRRLGSRRPGRCWHRTTSERSRRSSNWNKKALAAVDALQFDTARDGLLQAVTVAKQANLLTHKMLARTYVHLGAVYSWVLTIARRRCGTSVWPKAFVPTSSSRRRWQPRI